MRTSLASLLILPLTMAGVAAAEEEGDGVVHHLRVAGLAMPYYWSVDDEAVKATTGSLGEAKSSIRIRGGYTAQFAVDADVSTLVGVHFATTTTEDKPLFQGTVSDLEITENALLAEVGVAATPADWFQCEFALLLGGGMAGSELNGVDADQGWVVEGSLVIRPVVVLGPVEIFGEAGYNYRIVSVDYEQTGQRLDAQYKIDGFHGGGGVGLRF